MHQYICASCLFNMYNCSTHTLDDAFLLPGNLHCKAAHLHKLNDASLLHGILHCKAAQPHNVTSAYSRAYTQLAACTLAGFFWTISIVDLKLWTALPWRSSEPYGSSHCGSEKCSYSLKNIYLVVSEFCVSGFASG